MLKNNRKLVKPGQMNSSGFSLIEVVVAVVVITIVGIGAIALLNARAVGIEDKADVQEAQTRAEEALSVLTAIAADLPEDGSFEMRDEDSIKITECTSKTCDYVLSPDVPEDMRTSLAKGYLYQNGIGTVDGGIRGGGIIVHLPIPTDPIPKGYQVGFVRRWRVDEVDGNYNLRRITVAILKNEKTDQPLVIESAIVAVNR